MSLRVGFYPKGIISSHSFSSLLCLRTQMQHSNGEKRSGWLEQGVQYLWFVLLVLFACFLSNWHSQNQIALAFRDSKLNTSAAPLLRLWVSNSWAHGCSFLSHIHQQGMMIIWSLCTLRNFLPHHWVLYLFSKSLFLSDSSPHLITSPVKDHDKEQSCHIFLLSALISVWIRSPYSSLKHLERIWYLIFTVLKEVTRITFFFPDKVLIDPIELLRKQDMRCEFSQAFLGSNILTLLTEKRVITVQVKKKSQSTKCPSNTVIITRNNYILHIVSHVIQ